MCGRYVSFLPPDEIARIFRTVNPIPNIGPSLAPTQDALVVRYTDKAALRAILLEAGWISSPPRSSRVIC